MQKVVGIAFVDDGKLLIVQSLRSSKTNSWTFVGGGVEEGETVEDAAVREVSEEIYNGFNISKNDLKKLFTFQEYAASDPNKMIEMTVFLGTKQIDVELIPNEEILHYHWYKVGENYNISSSIKDHFLPYAQKNNIIY